MMRDDLVERLKAKAAKIDTIEEAWVQYRASPMGGISWGIYEARWKELVVIKAAAEAEQCGTADAAKQLLKQATGPAYPIFENRWRELADAEAEKRAKDCTTAEEALVLQNAAPSDSIAARTYKNRWQELVKSEAAQCTTAEEAKRVYEGASGDTRDIVRLIYEERWVELHLAE